MSHNSAPLLAVDVDGTLHSYGIANEWVIRYCEAKKAAGWKIMLWSAQGENHARTAAEKLGVTHLFDTICSKPTAVIDDTGWSWVKWTRCITMREMAASLTSS